MLDKGMPPGAESDLGGYLGSLDHGELVTLLLRFAERDPIVHRELALRAASNGSGRKPDSSSLAEQVDAALTVGVAGFDGMLDYAAKAESILDFLAELHTAGQVDAVAPLARQAVDRIADAVQYLNHVSPAMRGACERAVALAVQACTQSPPDPANLATWLLRHLIRAEYWPNVQLAAFLPALGADGLAALRKQAERAWAERGTAAWDDEAPISEDKLRRLRENSP